MLVFVPLWFFLQPPQEDPTWIADALGCVPEEPEDDDTPPLLGPDGKEVGPTYATPSPSDT